jgi:hypothetical protein
VTNRAFRIRKRKRVLPVLQANARHERFRACHDDATKQDVRIGAFHGLS